MYIDLSNLYIYIPFVPAEYKNKHSLAFVKENLLYNARTYITYTAVTKMRGLDSEKTQYNPLSMLGLVFAKICMVLSCHVCIALTYLVNGSRYEQPGPTFSYWLVTQKFNRRVMSYILIFA